MQTKTLQNLVLPSLKANRFQTFPGSGKAGIVFGYTSPQSSLYWRVKDHPKQQLLTLESSRVVSVLSPAPGILERINKINAECVGKFSLEDQERIIYCLDLPYAGEIPQPLFQHALNLALDTVHLHYETLRDIAAELYDKGLYDRIKDAFNLGTLS